MLAEAADWYAAFDGDQAVKFVHWFGCYVLEVGRREFGDPADNVPFFYDGFAGRAREARPGDDALYV